MVTSSKYGGTRDVEVFHLPSPSLFLQCSSFFGKGELNTLENIMGSHNILLKVL